MPIKTYCASGIALLVTLVSVPFLIYAGDEKSKTQAIEVLIRCDDIGMCHAVNMAIQEVLDTGLPVSTSVMFACPWYMEAVEVLKGYENVSVGVHLTLNAEWKGYRWGPVAGVAAVPTLVDSNGYFFPSRALFFANKPSVEDVERELRAQIERAIRSGLKIDYLDYHMSAAVSTLELRALVEGLAREYKLGISRYFSETDVEGWYAALVEDKKDTLLQQTRDLEGGAPRLFVFHVGLETPEMDALIDLNPFGPKDMSRHRQAELRALVSPEFQSLVKERKIRLKTYADLIHEVGLENMRRPTQP